MGWETMVREETEHSPSQEMCFLSIFSHNISPPTLDVFKIHLDSLLGLLISTLLLPIMVTPGDP